MFQIVLLIVHVPPNSLYISGFNVPFLHVAAPMK